MTFVVRVIGCTSCSLIDMIQQPTEAFHPVVTEYFHDCLCLPTPTLFCSAGVYLLIALYLSSKLFHQNQLHSLQEYVNDLSSKNDILLETVEDLEREANERVTLVEAKLQTTVEVVNKSSSVDAFSQR